MFQFCVAVASILLVLCLSLASFGVLFARTGSNAGSARVGPRDLPRTPVRRRHIGFRKPS